MKNKIMISIDGVLREMNDEEIAQFELDKAEQESLRVEQDAKIAARQSALAKLAALGLTEEEIASL
jgi:DNA-binding NarL/FixJ family response regulator